MPVIAAVIGMAGRVSASGSRWRARSMPPRAISMIPTHSARPIRGVPTVSAAPTAVIAAAAGTRTRSGQLGAARDHGQQPTNPPPSQGSDHRAGRGGAEDGGAAHPDPAAAASALRIASRGAGRPVISGNCANAWWASMSSPVAVIVPRARAAATAVGHGR